MLKNVLSSWSLTAKTQRQWVFTGVFCVLATSVVVGLEGEIRLRRLPVLAEKAAHSTAALVGGELGSSFAAVLSLGTTMEGMRAADHPPSRDSTRRHGPQPVAPAR
ncbi:MAG: hypothetical protein R3E42_20335 [Burkholderiaceae bacterium]